MLSAVSAIAQNGQTGNVTGSPKTLYLATEAQRHRGTEKSQREKTAAVQLSLCAVWSAVALRMQGILKAGQDNLL
jgi:hypothetical protein